MNQPDMDALMQVARERNIRQVLEPNRKTIEAGGAEMVSLYWKLLKAAAPNDEIDWVKQYTVLFGQMTPRLQDKDRIRLESNKALRPLQPNDRTWWQKMWNIYPKGRVKLEQLEHSRVRK